MPIPYRLTFPLNTMQHSGLWGISPHFYGLYPCRGQVAYVLLTSAPVADRRIATPSLPLDLHVLSLSLAFILSQDQTLRCSNCFMSLLKIPLFSGSSILLTVFILNTCTTVVYVNFSKNSFQPFLSKRGAKVRIFIFIFQIFSKFFFRFIFSEVLSERLQDIRLDLPTSSLGISISGFLSPLSSCHHRISLDCGCKSTAL